MPAEDITLYAVWDLNTYYVTYVLNGGVNDPDNPDTFDVEVTNISLFDPTKEDYTFGGWYYDELFASPIDFENESNTSK